MESNFTTGIIIGIIIGIVGVKMLAPTETPAISSEPQVQTRTVIVPSYHNSYDIDEDPLDYATYGLHERGFR